MRLSACLTCVGMIIGLLTGDALADPQTNPAEQVAGSVRRDGRAGVDVDPTQVTGARIDESVIVSTLEVGATKRFRSLGDALRTAETQLRKGVATRIRIDPGVYREGGFVIDGRENATLRDTPLVIEAAGAGEVIISGSDLFPVERWTRVSEDPTGTLYVADWPHDFGFNPGGWQQFNPKLPFEHRSELAFINGTPLRQVMLEVYEYLPLKSDPSNWERAAPLPEGASTDSYVGVPQNVRKYGAYVYKGMTDPRQLPPGSFGVAERPENGDRIYLRLPDGVRLEDATIEVATRRHLLWLHAKRNLVLRGLTFQHAAGPIEAHKTVMVGHWWQPERGFTSGNVLIEDCVFQHNNNNQLYINWTDNVTLRNVVTRYGGYGGIIMDNVHNALWENIDNSFNHWRVGGGWASGAAKIHNTIGMVVRNYTAIGNTEGCGLWYDISCGNVTVDGATLIGNKIGLDWEISRGIHVRNAVVAGNARINVAIISGSDVTIENSIIAGAPRVGQFGFQASDRTSSENLAPLLGYPRVEKYLLDDLVIRNSAIVSHPQGPVGRVRESHNEGIDREGFVPPLFSQHHGSPDLFQRFLRNGVVDEANVWFSPKGSSAFGIRKLYPEDWQRRPTVNTWVDFAGWKRVVASRKSIFADPGFKSVVDFDFRPRAGGLVENMPLPRYTMPESTRSAWKAFVDAEHYRVDTRSNVVDVINP